MPQRRPLAAAPPARNPGESSAAVPRAGDAGGFFQTLAKSDLLPTGRAEELAAKLGGWSPTAAADELVREGLLTRYQADRVRAGRYRGFFLDRYRLLAVLGAGGMGNVYVARDEGDGPTAGQKVAVKVLAEGLRDDAGMIARLRYEGVAAGRVDHPNVVKALRFCKADNGPGDHLLAMEFVEAVSAEELLVRGGPVKASAACDFARQAALGLGACHAAGLVHRDVKPANLLVAADGTVKVADFGLALLKDQVAGEFSLQMIFGHDCLGSADYMAPEQSRNSNEVDPRADLYSLGCTLYSLLTARVPFPAKSGREVLRAHRHNAVPDVRRKAPDTPPAVAALVARLMAKDPADRPATAAEAADLLAPHAKRKPVAFDFEAILASRARHALKKARRRREEAARKAGRTAKPADLGATPEPQSDRETATTAGLDTQRPDGPRRTGSSSALAAVGAGGLSAAEHASAILGGDSLVRDSFADSSHVGRRLTDSGSRRGSQWDSDADWAAELRATVGDPPPAATGERGPAPATSPPTHLVPGGRLAALFSTRRPVRGGRLTVGRGEGCDVRVDFPDVSAEHCRLSWNGRAWRVRDLGSANGTTVNGEPVTGAGGGELGHGDVLTLAGTHRFTMRLGAPGRPPGPALLATAAGLIGAAGGLVWLL